ncbi:hypothetical protein [Paraburkholderia sp. BR10882]|uniref:hypothetical protein n=1 Tax=unclassified Paraburkholderia TaxID=2615204 RepID=UPI0034CE3124
MSTRNGSQRSGREEQLGGVVVLEGAAHNGVINPDWTGELYRPLAEAPDATPRNDATLIAFPYFAWHNRESGPMKVWLN